VNLRANPQVGDRFTNVSCEDKETMMITRYTAWPTGQQDEVRARIAAHRAADQIVQGVGFQDGRGCAVGCALDRYDHAEYVRVLGVPPEIAHLVDRIHEGLSLELALSWPGRVAAALTPGADTTHAWTRFALWLLTEECPSEAGSRVAALYTRRLAGDEPPREEWELAARTARAAMDAAMDAAADAARAAGSYERMADALERLLRECEVPA
jgi:hypothetical protein